MYFYHYFAEKKLFVNFCGKVAFYCGMWYTKDMDEIKIGKYRHFKGMEYEVLFLATHSETGEKLVVYRALYGEGAVWVRPMSMWNERVERDGQIYQRFTYIGE